MSVEARVAIVTGAGTLGQGVGVGKAIAAVLAREGAKLVLVDVDKDRVAETEEMVRLEGEATISCVGDVSHPADCQRIVEEAVQAFGTIDILAVFSLSSSSEHIRPIQ